MSNSSTRIPTLLSAAAFFMAIFVLFAPQSGRASERDCLLACVAQGGANSIASCAPKCNAITLDYRCLNQCVAQGTNPYRCRQGCSYVEPETLRSLGTRRLTGSAQFAPVVPVGTDDLQPAQTATPPSVSTPSRLLDPKSQPLSPSTNYKCVAQCVQQGMASGFCTQACSY